MADIIKMNYPLMEAMAYAFDSGSETLETTIGEVNSIAQMLADGALLGNGGTAFEEACRGTLVPVLQRLQAKFDELESDIISAMESMKKADTDTTGFVGF